MFTTIQNIQNLFTELDQDIDHFSQAANLTCLPGCGACCDNPQVHASIAECLPLAWYLLKNNLTAPFETADDHLRTRPCLLQANNPAGCCSVYPYRGLICRLFGFSTNADKYDKISFAVCKWLKQAQPSLNENINTKINDGLKPPIMANYSFKIYQLAPNLSVELYPINIAIKLAIQKVGLYEAISGLS